MMKEDSKCVYLLEAAVDAGNCIWGPSACLYLFARIRSQRECASAGRVDTIECSSAKVVS